MRPAAEKAAPREAAGATGAAETAGPRTWRAELRAALRTGDDLAAAGLIAPARAAEAERVRAVFDVAIPPSYLDAIAAAGPADPAWRSAVPSAEELIVRPEELRDPIGDEAHAPVPGVTHRHPDRALLKPTHACAVYCRFCFRRYAVGKGEQTLRRSELEAALGYIERTPELWEVILTGGDPLVLSDGRLGGILDRLRAIGHVRVLRVHTRVPAVLPARVTDSLAALLAGPRTRPRKPVWVVLHVNHARELTPAAEAAIDRLADRGIPLLNQSVLLRGINDTVAAQEALLRRLVELRVKPYYLHHADLARGTGHFRTTLEAGQALVRALRGRASGLCQPAYVLDLPGGHGKVPVGPGYVHHEGGETWIEDPEGTRHRYPPAVAPPRRRR
jgi:lysine 2,3-aminomutase